MYRRFTLIRVNMLNIKIWWGASFSVKRVSVNLPKYEFKYYYDIPMCCTFPHCNIINSLETNHTCIYFYILVSLS